MTDLGYSKMHQLYGAMSVCGKTIEGSNNRNWKRLCRNFTTPGPRLPTA